MSGLGQYWALRFCVLAAVFVAVPSAAGADPHAHFSLRLAPGSVDGDLVHGDPFDESLELELWVEVTDLDPGIRVGGFSFFINTGQNGVIVVNSDFEDVFPTWSVLITADDNTPETGDLSRAFVDLLFVGTDLGVGQPAKYGTFTITTLGNGSASYVFDDEGAARPWGVSLSDFSSLTGSSLSFSIDPAIDGINVGPSLNIADIDYDGDTDLVDYAGLQRCIDVANAAPAMGACASMDIDTNGFVDVDDLDGLVAALDGPDRPRVAGDLDDDLDVDLGDYAIIQICESKADQVGFETLCADADIDRNDDVDVDDYIRMAHRFRGPNIFPRP